MKTEKIVIGAVRLIAALTAIISLILGLTGFKILGKTKGENFTDVFNCVGIIAITVIIWFLDKKTFIKIPSKLQAIAAGFLFFAMYLGNTFHFYKVFWWWDILLHFYSSSMLVIMGYMLFYSFVEKSGSTMDLNRIFMVLFAFSFAMTCGVVWEFFEFAGDVILGTNMQRSVQFAGIADIAEYVNKWGFFRDPGLMDTMKDLLVNATGALVSSVAGYFYVKTYSKAKDREDLEKMAESAKAELL